MVTEELKTRLASLEHRIGELEAQIRPLQDELRRLRDYRDSVVKVIELEGSDTAAEMEPGKQVLGANVPRKRGGDVHWQDLAGRCGFLVNGDSAHRVVMRDDPSLHRAISHFCTYDKRRYPI